MNILLSGGTGYIGLRLLPQLLEAGHTVQELVRDRARFPEKDFADFTERLHFIEEDLLEPPEGFQFLQEIQAAYFSCMRWVAERDFASVRRRARSRSSRLSTALCCKQIVVSGRNRSVLGKIIGAFGVSARD